MDWENHFSDVSCSTLPKGLSMEWDLMSYSTPDHYAILLNNRRLSEKSPFSSKKMWLKEDWELNLKLVE